MFCKSTLSGNLHARPSARHGSMAVVSLLCFATLLFVLSNALGLRWSSETADDLQQLFEGRNSGWTGGSVATSIAMDKENTLWIFDESIVGEINDGTRTKVQGRPHNMLALVSGHGYDKSAVTFFWRETSGKPSAVFYPKEGNNTFYWILSGIKGDNGLLLLGAIVKPTDYPGIFNFEIQGTIRIVVSNISGDPLNWNFTQFKFTATNSSVNWFSSISCANDYKYNYPHLFSDRLLGLNDVVYILGSSGQGIDSSAVLGRAKLTDLMSFDFYSFEVYVESVTDDSAKLWASWEEVLGVNQSRWRLVSLFSPAVSEGSLVYSDDLNSWYILVVRMFDYKIDIWTAANVTGPWSCTLVYEIPEPWRDTAVYLNYAAKSHPELATQANEIVFTYMTKAVTFSGLFQPGEAKTYVPQFVRLRFTDDLAPWEIAVLVVSFTGGVACLVAALVFQQSDIMCSCNTAEEEDKDVTINLSSDSSDDMDL